MKQKKIILFAIFGSALFLLSCNLFTKLTMDMQSIEDGQTAIVQLTQIDENLAQATQTAKKVQITQAFQQHSTQAAYEALSTQVAELLADQNSIFSSDFETDNLFSEFADKNGLVESHFRNGGLEMTIHEKDVYFWSYPNAETPKNISLQVETKLVDGDQETGAGVICKYDYDTDQGIYFEITFDGFYVVLKNSDEGWEYLQDFTSTNLIDPYQFNSIQAVCDQNFYQFYVNNNLVAEFNDYDSLGDETAIYGYTYVHPESVILFDNFYAEGLE